MLKRTHRVSSEALTTSFPRSLFHQETFSGGERGRPRRGKTPKLTRGKALQERYLLLGHQAPSRAGAKRIPWD